MEVRVENQEDGVFDSRRFRGDRIDRVWSCRSIDLLLTAAFRSLLLLLTWRGIGESVLCSEYFICGCRVMISQERSCSCSLVGELTTAKFELVAAADAVRQDLIAGFNFHGTSVSIPSQVSLTSCR